MTRARTSSLAALFAPRTVAVVGASRDPSKVGGSVLANLKAGGFPGRIVPVNDRASVVQGLAAVPTVLDAADPIDLAVIAVPARDVQRAVEQCAAKGAGAVIVISAGFRELGDAGLARERALREWLDGQAVRLVGPNCLGWIRPQSRLNVTFAPGMPAAGSIAFVSHSGALAVAILDWSRDRHMGFSLFASLGNQADVTETDMLRAVAEDAETRVIALYLEGVADGRAFVAALADACAVKPVVVLKTGRSAEGARAVSSHTGALAGSDEAFDAAIRQAGAVRVRTIEELFDLARALEAQPLPAGRRLVVVTNGGGLGIVATDAARDAHLDVPAVEGRVRDALRAVLPAAASVGNPIDLVGDADAARFSDALHALDGVAADAMLTLVTAQAATDSANVARAIVSATRALRMPVLASFVGGPRVRAGAVALEEAGIPCYAFPERAVAALAGMVTLADRRRSPRLAIETGPPPPSARAATAALVERGVARAGLLDLVPLLAAYGIACAEPVFARTPDDTRVAAEHVRRPVVLKVVSRDITHKTDVGGVRLGLESAGEVADAARAMALAVHAARPDARIDGFLLQPMIRGGVELLVGAIRDAQFGPLVVVGFGGVHVEILRDTSLRLAPIDERGARGMLDELRMAPLLDGVRGAPAVDRAAIAAVIARFSRLAADLPELAEIEINPLVAQPDGAVAVDARATLRAR